MALINKTMSCSSDLLTMFMIRLPFFLAYGMRKFTRSGFEKASKSFIDDDLAVDLKGKHILITGGNQGIGFSAAISLAKRGATIHLVCRSLEKGEEAVTRIKSETGNEEVHLHICNVSSLQDIKKLATDYKQKGLPVHVLINNAGVMVDHSKSADGYETNFATNTLGSHAMTRAFESILKSSAPSRVIFVSSGGSLTEPLVVDDLEGENLKKDSNFGQTQYARDKRRQVVIAERLAEEYSKSNIFVCSMHPGWCDTAGVVKSMPSFHERFKGNLRKPEEGADTIVWLSVKDTSALEPGGFYLDRTPQSKHLPLAATGYSKEEAETLIKKLDVLSKPAVPL
jgi:dehydrogenase/reductase SDR family protein 12